MADKTFDDDQIDPDMDAVEEDDFSAAIRKAYAESGADDDDDEDLADAPSEPADPMVSEAEGAQRADEATLGKRQAPAEKPAPADETEAEEAPAPEPESLDVLLAGIDEAKATGIRARMAAADKVMAPFRTPAAIAELQRHGTTPEAAMNRMMELNAFAQRAPDEYLAWVATEVGNPAEVLEKAAARLGYKIEKETDDEDLFQDDETKAIIEENKRLKAQLSGNAPEFGPDTAQRRAERDVQSWATETDDRGQAKRPLIGVLASAIGQKAQAHATASGRPATLADLDRFYTEAETEARALLGVSAAPAAKPVAQAKTTDAAALDKARRASKSIDGTGQGANRRPALGPNATLDEVLQYTVGAAYKA